MKKIIRNYFFIAIAIVLLIFCGSFCGASNFSKGTRYSGYGENLISTYSNIVTETVTFTRREESYIETVKGVPLYTQISTLSNSCGPTGGAIIVGFYDKYYEDLIPDYNPCLSTGRYKGNDRTAIPQLMGELYTLMRTNVDDVGVSESDCVNGLKAYVENKNHSLSYSNVRSGSTINISSLTSAINSNVPAIVFCSKMDLYSYATNSGNDSISYLSYVGGHVVVGYGFLNIKYYNGDTMFREDNYMRVATGLPGIQSAYIKLSTTGWCNAAYAVNVS